MFKNLVRRMVLRCMLETSEEKSLLVIWHMPTLGVHIEFRNVPNTCCCIQHGNIKMFAMQHSSIRIKFVTVNIIIHSYRKSKHLILLFIGLIDMTNFILFLYLCLVYKTIFLKNMIYYQSYNKAHDIFIFLNVRLAELVFIFTLIIIYMNTFY